MKLIRWLFSNIILIAFILALTYAYVYWDDLTGPDTPAGKAIAVLSDEFESVRQFVESYQPDTEPDVEASEAGTETAAAVQAAEADTQTTVAAEQQTAPEPQPSAVREASRQPVVADPPVVDITPPAARRPEPSPVPASQVEKPAIDASTRQLWIEARTAFQSAQYDESIDRYRNLIESSAGNFDAWGELGNVYLRTGNTAQAAAAYYEAAAIMVQNGQKARARSVLPLLRRLDRDKARQLNELILSPAGRGGP